MGNQEDKDKRRDVSEIGKKTADHSSPEWIARVEEEMKRYTEQLKSGELPTNTEDVHDLIPMPWMYKKNTDD